MAGSSFRDAPFLTYLTVFSSRLGITNIVLSITSFAYTPTPTLERQLKRLLSGRSELSTADSSYRRVFDYLQEKHVIGGDSPMRGRYSDWTLKGDGGSFSATYRGKLAANLSVFQTDVWLADDRIPSTIGVPTPENVSETIDLNHQLQLLTRAKNSWTAAGHAVVKLREKATTSGVDTSNPFVLTLERIALLRQVIAKDGLLLQEILSRIVKYGGQFSRDDVAGDLLECARCAYRHAQELRYSPPSLAEARSFVELLRRTAEKFKGQRGGPGVLEHRTAPRLEWLTDLGALSKNEPRNSFRYTTNSDTELLSHLISELLERPYGPEEIALAFWRTSESTRDLRTAISNPDLSHREVLSESYQLLQRSVGPAPLNEICFVALALKGDEGDMSRIVRHAIEWAEAEAGVTLSGGRFTRVPEFIHIAAPLLGKRD